MGLRGNFIQGLNQGSYKDMRKFMTKLWQDESGISSVEYALLLAFVAAGIIIGAEVLSQAVEDEMKDAASCIRTGDTTNAACGGN